MDRVVAHHDTSREEPVADRDLAEEDMRSSCLVEADIEWDAAPVFILAKCCSVGAGGSSSSAKITYRSVSRRICAVWRMRAWRLLRVPVLAGPGKLMVHLLRMMRVAVPMIRLWFNNPGRGS
jgi:hypothetical protein